MRDSHKEVETLAKVTKQKWFKATRIPGKLRSTFSFLNYGYSIWHDNAMEFTRHPSGVTDIRLPYNCPPSNSTPGGTRHHLRLSPPVVWPTEPLTHWRDNRGKHTHPVSLRPVPSVSLCAVPAGSLCAVYEAAALITNSNTAVSLSRPADPWRQACNNHITAIRMTEVLTC